MTNNIEKRIKEHSAGKTKSNKYYAPFKLFYQESFTTRFESREREKELKSGYGKEQLKKLLKT